MNQSINYTINELDRVIAALKLQRDFLRALQKSDIETSEEPPPYSRKNLAWLLQSGPASGHQNM
jgi:hypothetical protein